ncbi:MAG: hypothetical protein PF436_01580 [Prolixibacteraceae bacterium]|jgi:hypothetical protein|nr:hypothetical protein [Prolixibacteraceae bacterium]
MERKEEMQRYIDKSKEIANRSEVISGIYNYCDRWCDRCTFTSRCSLYLTEQEMGWDENADMENQEFWDRMSLVFESTMEMLHESAHKFGIDLDNPGDVDISEPEETEIEQFARDYTLDIHNWLIDSQDYFDEKMISIASDSTENIVSVTDALEVIEWYSMFITAKTHRAFYSYELEKDADELSGDSQGSAKIAVIGIERSLKAFTVLYHQLPEMEDDLLGFMVHLEKLKKAILVAVPDAMEFKRPGFDD